MTQHTEFSATIQVASGLAVPRLKALRAALAKLAKDVPPEAEIVLEKYEYGFVENGPKYKATRLVARWSRFV